MCLIAAALKSFYGMKAFKDNLSRMSILKVSCLYTPFVNFFSDIAKGLKKSSIYEREKSLLDTIIRNCEHSKPSQKNIKHLKDLPTLIRKIISLIRSTKKSPRKGLNYGLKS